MNETADLWSDELDAAWRGFRERLGEQLDLLEPDEVLRLDGGADCATPYLRMIGLHHGGVLVEVLDDDLVARRRFEQSPTYAPIAVLAESALRQVFGVLHPAFLDDARSESDRAEPTACFPASREQLVDLVDRALWPLLGDLGKDDDGDVVVVVGESVLHVRVVDDGPAVDVSALLVRDVAAPDRALVEINIANRPVAGPTYLYRGGQIIVQQRVSARPFAPQQLRDTVAAMIESLDERAGDLIGRVGGSRLLGATVIGEPAEPDARPSEDEARDCLRTLMHLEADQPGSVDPRLASYIFRNDEQAILTQITRLRRDGRVALVPLLRRALRVAVETGAH